MHTIARTPQGEYLLRSWKNLPTEQFFAAAKFISVLR